MDEESVTFTDVVSWTDDIGREAMEAGRPYPSKDDMLKQILADVEYAYERQRWPLIRIAIANPRRHAE